MRWLAVVVGVALVACNSSGSNSGGDGGPPGDGTVTDATDATIDAAIDAPPDAPPDAPDGPSSGIGGPPLGTCTGAAATDWCWVLPRPQGDPITAVWASSASDVWFSTYYGLLHFDGSSWAAVPSQVKNVQYFTGLAPNDVWAVTSDWTFHWDGTAWTIAQDAASGSPAIAQFAVNDVWTINQDTAKHWDGSTWTTHPGPGFRPLAVGGDATNLIAISGTGTIAKLLGTQWGVADASSHPGNAAVVIDPTHIVVAQDQSIQFWDNGTWTTNTPVAQGVWKRLAARTANDVWVTSSYGRYHWNGTTWASDADPTNGFIVSIWQAQNGEFFVADMDAQIRRWNAGTWTGLTTGPGKPNAMWGTSNTDIWAVTGFSGPRPFAVHWDGVSWTEFPVLGVHSINAIWGAHPNDYWIGAGYFHGNNVDRILAHWDGTAWTNTVLGLEDNTNSSGIMRMHGFADNDVFAASVNQLFHYDGTTWSPVMVPVTRITDVFGTSATDLYVASYSTLAHWNGSAWTTRAAPLSIAKGIAVSPTNLWFVGPSTTPPGHSELVNFDGTFFVTVAADLCSNGLVARGSEIYVCEGDAINPVFSMVTKRPNTLTGTATPYAPARPLESSWFSPDGHLYVPGMMVHAP